MPLQAFAVAGPRLWNELLTDELRGCSSLDTFKKKLKTEFIEYFKRRSTSVYVAFLDASKAFDKINHWVLFKKLINRGIPIYLVKLLCYWYQHQSMYVKWGSTMSSKFQVTNGVRQGGVLSPLLFDVYVNELSELLNKSGIGGNLSGTLINHMLYADDII